MASKLMQKLRSLSPKMSPRSSRAGSATPKMRNFHHREKGKDTLCRAADCKATLIVDGTKFIVCKHQLAHAADYFRELFTNDQFHDHDDNQDKERSMPKLSNRFRSEESIDKSDDDLLFETPGGSLGLNEYSIAVGRGHPQQVAPKLQFQWFLEAVVPNPVLRDITDEVLQPLMRLSQRFGAAGLRIRCTNFVKQNAHDRAPMAVLHWLSWCLNFAFPVAAVEACLPIVCRLPLNTLEDSRGMIGDRVFGDIIAAKLRASYDQAVSVYQQIHAADHFTIELPECPRCHMRIPSTSRTTEPASEIPGITIACSPCHRVVGCERCMRDKPCICDPSVEYEAIYHCKHGARVLSDKTMDCHCQAYKLKIHEQTCDGGVYLFNNNGTVGLAPLARYETM